MATNGSPAPLFETDDERASFVVRLPVHSLVKQPTVDETTDVTVDVAALLQVIQGDMPRPTLQTAMSSGMQSISAKGGKRTHYLGNVDEVLRPKS